MGKTQNIPVCMLVSQAKPRARSSVGVAFSPRIFEQKRDCSQFRSSGVTNKILINSVLFDFTEILKR